MTMLYFIVLLTGRAQTGDVKYGKVSKTSFAQDAADQPLRIFQLSFPITFTIVGLWAWQGQKTEIVQTVSFYHAFKRLFLNGKYNVVGK